MSILKKRTGAPFSKDVRTFLSTPRSSNVNSMGKGSFYYFGMKRALAKFCCFLDNVGYDCKRIELFINVDGVELYRNGTKGFNTM